MKQLLNKRWMVAAAVALLCGMTACAKAERVAATAEQERYRVVVTSDAEIDDECSMMRFMLYMNEWDVEAIISSSSQFHAHDHNWAGDDWLEPYLDAYEAVYPNLKLHDARYPAPDKVRSISMRGNVATEGEMEEVTAGSQKIVELLLDASDHRPIWFQAWGGTNTIARALKTIEEQHPERMEEVAAKVRLYLIWEQDNCFQTYIRPVWGKYNIPTVISDQFIAYFYHWKKYIPQEQQAYLCGEWMNEHILQDHGALCSLYKAHDNGDFRSEGDSPAYFYLIPTGLDSPEHPDWGGWGGRYVRVRKNTWLDPVEKEGYTYPEGRWYTSNAWGRTRLKQELANDAAPVSYLKPMWRWMIPLQNDFAARADWCVKPYEEANHAPIVRVNTPNELTLAAGTLLNIDASLSTDPDGDNLAFRWWHYKEAGSYRGDIEIENAGQPTASIRIPYDAEAGDTIHLICEVQDDGTPVLTRYQRVVVTVEERQIAFPTAEGYGKYTVGGRGGRVIEVTNLNDAGEGSLRAAIEAKGPRTVVFRVAGTIDLESPLTIRHPYITIAGQTAPGEGICIKRHPLNIDADEVIVRYLRVRLGDESGNDTDAVSSRGHRNIILDHLSTSWSIDECLSVYQCEYVTIQWCLVAESLAGSNHIKGSHGYGGIWGSNYCTMHHNLLAHHSSRNPRFASGAGYNDYRNNVIYNWGFQSCYGGEELHPTQRNPYPFTYINMVANYYKAGPATLKAVRSRIVEPSYRNSIDNYGRWYVAGNVVEGDPRVTADNWDGGVQVDPSHFDTLRLEQPWPAMPIDEQTANDAYLAVLEGVGAVLPCRDAIDNRLIEEVRLGKATYEGASYKREHAELDGAQPTGIIDSQDDVGGWPKLKAGEAPQDSDHDGMPDRWERRNSLNPNDAADGAAMAENGYTNLENYLNSL